MIAYGHHVLSNVGAELANLVVLGSGTEMFSLEMGVHGNVSLESFLAHRTLEAKLGLEFLLASGGGRQLVMALLHLLGGGRDALMSKLHEQIGVHFFTAGGGGR